MSTQRFISAPALALLSITALFSSDGRASDFESSSFNASVQALPALTDAAINDQAKLLLNEGTSTPERMSAVLRDETAYRRWREFEWQVGRAMDERGSLVNSEQYGLIRQQDGRYKCDLKNFPQWVTLDQRMMVLLMPSGIEHVLEQLRQRGFRDADLKILADYIGSHDPAGAALNRNVGLAKSFAARLQQRKSVRVADRNAEIESFIYQRRSNEWQESRKWAVGLFDLLDPQRQRILKSWILEQPYSRSIRPDNRQTIYELNTERLMSGQYVRDLEKEIQQ